MEFRHGNYKHINMQKEIMVAQEYVMVVKRGALMADATGIILT
jgi:hypothetical protein